MDINYSILAVIMIAGLLAMIIDSLNKIKNKLTLLTEKTVESGTRNHLDQKIISNNIIELHRMLDKGQVPDSTPPKKNNWDSVREAFKGTGRVDTNVRD
jgi:hypothetical protein